MTRQEIQQEALNDFNKHNTIILQWGTGIGKSYAALNMCIKYCALNNKDFKILLLVAETAHKENWIEEIKKWNLSELLNIMTIETYASLKKYKDTSWDIIIADEAHHLISDIRSNILYSIKANKVILLSATVPLELFEIINFWRKDFYLSTITVHDAIKWGILPEPKVFLIPLLLDNQKESEIIIEGRGKKDLRVLIKCSFKDRWKYLKDKHNYPNLKLEISCTQQQKYDYLNAQIEYWKAKYFQTNQERVKNKWLQLGSQRKRYLGECKTLYADLLLKKIKDKRFICFCSSIEQAEFLGGSNCIHSKKKDSLNIIQSFNNKKINNLFAVGMLQEGQNLNDIKAGVIIQLDGKERAFIQKFGRILRSDSPQQFIFYYKNTKDIDYLNNIIEDIDSNYITEINNLLTLI